MPHGLSPWPMCYSLGGVHAQFIRIIDLANSPTRSTKLLAHSLDCMTYLLFIIITDLANILKSSCTSWYKGYCSLAHIQMDYSFSNFIQVLAYRFFSLRLQFRDVTVQVLLTSYVTCGSL